MLLKTDQSTGQSKDMGVVGPATGPDSRHCNGTRVDTTGRANQKCKVTNPQIST